MAHIRRVVLSSLILLIGVLLPLAPLTANTAQALSGSSFNAGNIIDDALFFDGGGMNAGVVQQFLNAKVPVCDTNGTQPYAGTTRAAYAASRGYPAPFTCLKDYSQATPSMSGEHLLCNPLGGGHRSAAQIIADVGAACGISPKVLLILLQKEQSLVTDDWPWSSQYAKATGFACPDTAPCDSQYSGFFYQVYYAARQFKKYARDYTQYGYRAQRNNFIRYNPNANCGGSNVFIENQATAGLYVYTPYQPNPPALSNLYGTGDACSAYGNRNFWRMWNDWFGSTISTVCTPDSPVLPQAIRLYNPVTYEHFYTALSCEANILVKYHGFSRVGLAYNTTGNLHPYARPVYRLYNPRRQLHFWTYSLAESEAVQRSLGYSFEGIAFYMLAPEAPNGFPVYRLYNPNTEVHFWTQTYAEADSAARHAGYRFEGTALYSQ